MERPVFLVVGNEEYYLGSVKEVLSSNKQQALVQAVQDMLDEMVFSDNSANYTVFSLEVR